MKTLFKNLCNIFRRSKRAMIITILGLSVSFAAFLVILMQVDFDRSFDACHEDADRIYRIELGIQGNKFAMVSKAIAEWVAQSPQIESSALASAMLEQRSFTIRQNHYNEQVQRITPSFTEVFHFDMVEGSDKALNLPGQILLPESLARKIFGNRSAVGKRLEEVSQSVTVGGVYRDFPRNSTIGNFVYVAIPEKERGGWSDLNYVAYVKAVSYTEMEEEQVRLEEGLAQVLKDNESDMPAVDLYLSPFRELHNRTDVLYDYAPKSDRNIATLLLTVAFAIIVVASINYMNMSMALVPKRMKSINMQRVLGATNSSIRRNYVMESVAISLFSFGVGLLLVWIASYTSLTSLVDADIALGKHPGLLLAVLTIALALGVVSGLYPSFYVTSFRPAMALKEMHGMSLTARNLRKVLIGIQFVTASVLIMSAWFMYLQNSYLRQVDAGYDRERVILARVNPRIVKSKGAFTEQLKSYASISGVTYANCALSTEDTYNSWSTQFKGERIMYQWIPVDPSFLDVMGIQISEGRGFREQDRKTGKYIFNEKAKAEFGLELNMLVDSKEIVGFIPDIQYTTFRTASAPMAFYVPAESQDYTQYAYIKVKAGSDMRKAMEYVKSVVGNYSEGDDPLQVRFYDEVFNQVYEKEQRLTLLISLFSLLAVVISLMGVLGLVFFENEYRRREIGIRKVLGSTEMEILVLFNRSYLEIVLVCFIVACGITHYFISRWLENFSLQMPLHWWVFGGSGLAIVFITVLTVSWQSWRSAASNPLDGIRG